MICPSCGSKIVGKVGPDQYYCWDCFVEFYQHGNQMQVFRVELDGTLVSVESGQQTLTSS